MNAVKILTDSCADIGRATRDAHGIDYVHMYTEFDGTETPASLDWEYYTPHEFYNTMRSGGRTLTSQVPVEEFRRVFKKYLEQECDIVYVGCSLKQSGSLNTGTVVARELMKEYPGTEIHYIDSLNTSMGEGLLALRAAAYRDRGLTACQIAGHIARERNLVNEYCTVHSLDALKRAGRVKASSAFLGNLLGVKPIIIAEAEGYQMPIKKVRGRQTSMQEIVMLLKDSITSPEKQTICIAHGDCIVEAKQLEELVRREIPCRDVYCDFVGPIIGASVGPDALGVFAFGQEVTFRG